MSSLPQEVDVKKRGQKMYPVLEKVNLQSAPGVVEKGEKDGKDDSSQQPPSPSASSAAVSSSSNPSATITTDSAIYTLFDQNIGALTDNHGVPHPPATLVAALKSSTETVGTYLKKLKKKQNKKYQIQMPTSSSATSKEPQSQLSPSSQSSTTSSALVEELSKLYLGCMKQSAFLRQNLWNMEEYCASHLSKEDIKSTFPIKRKDVEAVYRKMQMHKMQTLREKRMERIREHQRKERQKRKVVASDKNALPTPLERSVVLQSTTLPEKNNLQAKKKKTPTHGGPNSTPIITLKVKVKVSGWRDKSGARLTARLWCPTQWKVALKCAKNLILLQSGVSPNELVKPPMGGVPVGPLDLSGVEEGTMEAVARELVRFDLVPNKKKKEKVVAVAAAAASAAAAAAAVTSSGGMVEGANKAGETIEKLKPPSTMSLAVVASGGSDADVKKGDAVADTKEVKKTTKKRKAKDQSSDSASSTTSSSATSSSTSVVLGKKNAKLRKIIPYVPRYDRPRFHPAILAPAAASSTAKSSLKKEDSNIFVQEQNRLFHHFYNQILNTNLSPTERRTLLANELSSTLARLENHRKSSPSYKKMHEIQTQLEELQTIYLEDVDIVPDKGGCTIGMWNWLKRNNYFENDNNDNGDDGSAELTTEEDVYEGLEGIWQPELNNHIVMDEDDREEERNGIVVGCGDWGKVSESKKVVVKSEEGGAKRSMQKEDDTPSPLFDRLQSLLVEEDEGSDEDDDDDDDLIANLPPYSPEEFIYGPKNGRASVISSDEDDGPDDAMLDVSALTLDQRTFIQLRAAGLVDASTPFNDAPPPPQPSTLKSTKTPVANEEDDEPIDAILTKMKSHLSTLHAQNNTNVAILQRKALSHVLSPTTKQHRTKRGMTKQEDVITLARYKQLQKVQKAQQEEKQRQIRTSTRVKTGSNKFDGEQWLPW